jgi:uncharacterized protein with PQ loop repeat
MGKHLDIVSAVLIIVSTISSTLGYLPQIIKTTRTKKAGDISVWMLILWVLSNTTIMLYAIIYTTDTWFIMGSAASVSLIVYLLVLNIIYRER